MTTTTALAAIAVASPASALADAFTLSTSTATGDQVVPGPGDPTAYGEPDDTLRLTLGGSKGGTGKVANGAFFWSATGTPTALGIHKGVPGTPGPVIVDLPLDPDPNYQWSYGRANPEECVMLKIVKKPSRYYVQGDTDVFPGGAIRAQLKPDPYNADDPAQAAKLFKELCKKKKGGA
jgi:hypothetical protein